MSNHCAINSCDLCCHEQHSLWSELICHVPLAVVSLAFAFIFLSLTFFVGLALPEDAVSFGYHVLFHSFHYLHIIVSVAGAALTYFRFATSWFAGIMVALIAPTFFCILSDILLPALSGRLLGVDMEVHVCFFQLYDAINLFVFMAMGLLAGLALSKTPNSITRIASYFHSAHTLISSMASVFYMVAHGFDSWFESMGILFLFMFVAVILPCTLSDIVVPFYCARGIRK